MTPTPFIIAEIGVNHDGSLQRALDLVAIAKQAGANAVKLQIFRGDQLMNKAASFATYQKDRVTDPDPAAMLRRYELSEPDLQTIVSAITSANLIPLATPFSLEDLPVAARLNLPLLKIASPDLINYPLLRSAGQLNKPLILSTGAATLDEITETLSWFQSDFSPTGGMGDSPMSSSPNSSFPPAEKNGDAASFPRSSFSFPRLSLLHCISSYPTPPDQTHLSWIRELSSRFPTIPIGYSDHSTETLSGALAVAAGACILERHLTYDNHAPGPDHAASSNPADFAEYTRLARLAHTMLGTGPKRVLSLEQDVRTVSRQSLVTARPLPANHPLTESDLKTQRPGTGLPPKLLPSLLGRRTTRPLDANTLLDPTMFT